MKIESRLFKLSQRGYAMLITVASIGIAILLLAGMLTWVEGSGLQTERNNLFRDSTSAADAATEMALGYMWNDFYNKSLATASNYTGHFPFQTNWPVKFSFGNGSGTANQTAVTEAPSNWQTNWQALNSFGPRYVGLSAFVEVCTVTSEATTTNQPYKVSATVQQKFDLAGIPIFQFAVFYNLNMEIDPGVNMDLTGPVFSNGGIWARGLATYNSGITAVGVVDTNGTDPYLTNKNDSNLSIFNDGVTSNASSLSVPIGTNSTSSSVQALLGLPPTNTSPYSTVGQTYFVNQANIIISNSSTQTLSAFYQDPDNLTNVTPIPDNVTTYSTNGSHQITTNSSYSFATNVTFYDYRESKTVDAVQVDVGKFNTWLTNASGGQTYNNQMYGHSGHYINSVYVYNNAPSSSSVLPSVRVDDGATLPSQGLTVVTPDPIYVLGNYNASGVSLNNGTNVENTVPASLIGDAITVLSSSWKDTNNASTPLDNRTPSATTVNAATFEGIVQSTNGNYSGGVENFLRLEENWQTATPVTLTYNGSIVVMFASKYATNPWVYGGYYTAPTRAWSFDLNFMTQNGLPPLTPEIYALVRQSWAVVTP